MKASAEAFFLTELEPSEPSEPGGVADVRGVPSESLDVVREVSRQSGQSRANSKVTVSSVGATRLVVLYDFDPASMGWPHEGVKPLPVVAGQQVQVISDDGNGWTYGHVVGVPETEGFFPRDFAITLPKYYDFVGSVQAGNSSSSLMLPVVRDGSCASRAVSEDMAETCRLRVLVKRATNLRNADWLSVSDPCCVVEIKGNERKSFRTKVIDDNLHPIWEESWDFDYTLPTGIHFSVWDKDTGRRDDFLGSATLSPEMFWRQGFDGHVVLEMSGKSGMEEAAHLYLKVERLPTP